MTDAVIVSTARTGLAKSWKGAFNMTHGATLGAHSIEHAVKRAGIDPAEVEDVFLGGSLSEGTTGGNIARVAALRRCWRPEEGGSSRTGMPPEYATHSANCRNAMSAILAASSALPRSSVLFDTDRLIDERIR